MPSKFKRVIQPFMINNLRFVHINQLKRNNKKMESEFFNLLVEEVQKYPDGLQCAANENTETARRRIKRTYGSLKHPEAIARLEEYKQRASQRMSVEDYLGEIFPINFAILQGGELKGGFQLYGIEVLSRTDQRLRIKAHTFPMIGTFDFDTRSDTYPGFVGQTYKHLLTQDLVAEDGFVVRVVELDAVPFGKSGETDLWLKRLEDRIETYVEQNVPEIDLIEANFGTRTYRRFVRKQGVQGSNIRSR